MTELEEAIALANKILDRNYADPDDDLAILSRQFLRAREAVAELERFSALLTRAADALEAPAWEWHKSWALAKELRKAAQ
jgi:hypothetical protein